MDTIMRRLREENEQLRERIILLEQMLCPPLPRVDGFSLGETRLVTAIAMREAGISSAALFDLVYGHLPESEQPETNTLYVRISIVRGKLRTRHPAISVSTMWGWGFRMDADSRRAWLDLVGVSP